MNTTPTPAPDLGPLYAERDHAAQGDYYTRHVSAMTGEKLHAKSAIAAELAHRDLEITRLRAAGVAAGAPALEDIEQYRLQMAGISTAAIGYWKEGDSIHPDYDTLTLRDVAKLYAKYAAPQAAPAPTRQPLTDEQIAKAVRASGLMFTGPDLKVARAIEAAHGIGPAPAQESARGPKDRIDSETTR